jgi:microcompartment protein CcmK/EutM
MMLARVIGTVVATVKYPTLEGRKLLLIQPVTREGVPRGKPLVAIDAVGAGVHETVYWCRGREAALAFDHEVISDASIVGIVDQITAAQGSDDETSVAQVPDPRARVENPGHTKSAASATGPACPAVGPSPKPASRRTAEKRGRK